MGVILKIQLKTLGVLLVTVTIMLSFLSVGVETAHAATIIRPPNNLGLVGYWSLDEGRGTQASDLSGNGNDGTLNGNPQWESGKSRGALSFSGVDDYVDVGNNASLNPINAITIAAWVYPLEKSASYRVVISKGANTNTPFDIRMDRTTNGNHIFGNVRTGVGTVGSGSTVINNNQWYHVVLLYDGTKVEMFIDGISVASNLHSGTINNSANNLTIGRNTLPGEFWEGFIDEARIYNRALSETEIQSLYVNTRSTVVGITPVDRYTDGLVGHWTFDGKHTTATTVEDIAGNNDGTISGDVSPAIGIIGQALEFNGGSSVVNVSPVPQIATNAITVSAWFKTNSLGFSQAIVRKNGLSGTNYDYVLRIHEASNMIAWAAGKVTGNISGVEGFTVTPGVWYHVVGTKTDSGSHSLYVNGNLVSTSARTSAVASGESLYLGGTGLSSINGSVDDVRIYNRALSASEIAGLYSATSSSKMQSSTDDLVTSGLVGHWSFDGDSVGGGSVNDTSGNGNNGTLVGATQVAGKIKEALQFDGVDDYVRSTTVTEVSTVYTASAWIYPHKTAAGNPDQNTFGFTILSDDGTGYPVWLRAIGGELRATAFETSNGGVTTAGAGITDNNWHHVVVSATKGGESKMYVNGELMNTWTNLGNSGNWSGNFYIGELRAARQIVFDGLIDDVRIYNRVLTEEEVTQLYSMGQ